MLALVHDLGRLIDAQRAHGHVAMLASDRCAGRAIGSAGEQRAAQYLVDQLRRIGARPLFEPDRYCDPFALTVSEQTTSPTLALAGSPATAWAPLRDFCVDVQGAASGGNASAETVWLGSMATAEELPDALHGRIGVCWSTPPSSGDTLRAAFESYLLRVRRARDVEARALLQIAQRVDRFKLMAHRHEAPGIPVLDIAPAVGRALFAPYPPLAVGQLGQPVVLQVALTRRAVQSAGNLVAELGSGAIGCVLVAHYDHLGALPDGRFFPGAADNAAGVAVALEATAAIAAVADRLQRRLVLLLTTAEEVGMYGAQRFVDRFGATLDQQTQIVCVDEIAGRGGRPLPLLATAAWRAQPQLLAACHQLDVGVQPRPLPPFGFFDAMPFVEAGLPLVASLTDPGEPDVVHTFDDAVDRIEPDRLAAAARALVAIVLPALS